MPDFAGFVYTAAGAGNSGLTVNLYARNGTSSAVATTTTNSDGAWTISHGTEGRFDVEIVVDASNKFRIKYDDQIQCELGEFGQLYLRGTNDAFTTKLVSTPTASRTITFPDATATALLGGYANTNSGVMSLTSTANSAAAVYLRENGGTSGTIKIHADQGTAATEGAASIQLLSDVGGINIKSGLNAADAILLTADGGTSEKIRVHADQGTGVDSIELTSDAGGIELNVASGVGITGNAIKDEDGMDSNSAVHIATQQSIKAYVDAQVTAQDLDFQGDSGGALSIDLDSETLDIAGGTGIDTTGSGNELSVAIDSTVATLTGSQTLTNKSITAPTITGTVGGTQTSATITALTISSMAGNWTNASRTVADMGIVTTIDINGGTIDGTVIGGTTTAAGSFAAVAGTTGTFSSNVSVGGNLTVNGTTTTVDTATLSVEDPLIALATGNSDDSLDVGFYGKYVDSGTKYAGLFRDQSDSDKWKLFATTGNSHEVPGTTVNTGTGFTLGTLVASAFEGDITGDVTGNADTATALATGRTIAMTGDVAWTSASFTGAGNVTGAGTIQANAVEGSMLNTNVISGQTEITSGLAAADELLYDDDGVLKKVGLDTLTTYLAGVNAGTVASTGLSDSSGVLTLDIQNLGASTTIADADLVVVDDGADGTLKKMTRANFIESAALDAINIDGGAIDGTTIGANSAAAGTFGALVSTTFAPTDDVTLAADKSLNLPQGANIDFTDVIADNGIDDHDAQGVIFTFNAGATVTPFSPVYLAEDNLVEEANASAIATMPCIGVSINTSDVTVGNPIKVLVMGLIRDDDFNFGTHGAAVYVSTTVGTMTSTAPSSTNNVVQVIGHSIEDDAIFVQPCLTTIEHA